MAKVIDFVEDNLITVNKLAKIGVLPLSFLQNYDIYTSYKSTIGIPQMQRYKMVSERLKISISSVRNAISFMERGV